MRYSHRDMLRRVPQVLQQAFYRALRERNVRVAEWAQFLRWMQFYLNFCDKYQHPPRDPDSLEPFLRKLAAKQQSLTDQQQAAASVECYYGVMKPWPSTPHPGLAHPQPSGPWDLCLQRLKEEVRLRQYSRRTYQAYAVWIRQFGAFLVGKYPAASSTLKETASPLDFPPDQLAAQPMANEARA